MALGGTAHDIVRLVFGSAWRMILPGLVLGIAAAWVATRALQGILFGTSPTDPVVFTATVLTLALVASVPSLYSETSKGPRLITEVTKITVFVMSRRP